MLYIQKIKCVVTLMNERNIPVLIPVRFVTDDNFPTFSPKSPSFLPSYIPSYTPSLEPSSITIKPVAMIFRNNSHITSLISIGPSNDNTFYILFISFASLCLFISCLWLAHCTFLVYTQPQKKPFVIFLFHKPANKTFNI